MEGEFVFDGSFEDVFTPEVIADLMLDEFTEHGDGEGHDHACTGTGTSSLPTDGHSKSGPNLKHNAPSYSTKSANEIIATLRPDVQLTDYGEKHISAWIDLFKVKKDPSVVVQQYPLVVSQWRNFFMNSLDIFQGPKLILDIMKEICSVTVSPQEPMGAEIGKWENDTLEYLGGYCLRKAKKKFKAMLPVLEVLCTTEPHGMLIPRMERKVGVLLYPSEEYMLLLQHVYLKFAVEANRNVRNIDFISVKNNILDGQYHQTFVHRVQNMLCGEANVADIATVVGYTIDLTVRLLSYSFTRKLFTKLSNNVEKCKSLRKSLKKKAQKL